MADAGFNPIIGVGFAYSDSVDAVSDEYKDINFGVVDGFDPTPNKDGSSNNPNVAYLGFAENEGSFLVGVAAAETTKSDHIGFVGGVHVDLIKKFEAGYIAGAPRPSTRTSRSTSSTSRSPTSPASTTPPVARPLPRRCTTTALTWSSTPRVRPARVSSTRRSTPATACGRSVSTVTSGARRPRLRSRTS